MKPVQGQNTACFAPVSGVKGNRRMTLHELASVGFRLLGVYVVVVVIQTLASSFQIYTSWATYPEINLAAVRGILLLQIILLSLLALVLFKFPSTLANLLLGKCVTGDKPAPSIKESTILDAGFCLLGVYILSWAIPDLIYNGLEIYHQVASESYYRADVLYVVVLEIATILEIAIGAFLALRAKGLRKLLWRIRGYENNSL